MNNMKSGLQTLKEIYQDAYENDPVVRNGFDDIVEIFITPLVRAIQKGEDTKIHEERLRLLFGLIGHTYNKEFPGIR